MLTRASVRLYCGNKCTSDDPLLRHWLGQWLPFLDEIDRENLDGRGASVLRVMHARFILERVPSLERLHGLPFMFERHRAIEDIADFDSRMPMSPPFGENRWRSETSSANRWAQPVRTRAQNVTENLQRYKDQITRCPLNR